MAVLDLLRRSVTLRLLLACLFVPLVLVSSTGTAQAAAVVIPMATAPVTSESRIFNVPMPRGTDVRCGLVYAMDPGLGGGIWAVRPGGWCENKAIPEYGAPALSRYEYEFTVKGEYTDRGVATSWPIAWTVQTVEDGWISQRVKMNAPSAPVTSGWQLHEVCLTITDARGIDRSGTDCQASSLATGVVSGQCEHGSVSTPRTGLPDVETELSPVSGYTKRNVFRNVQIPHDLDGSQDWFAYVVVRRRLDAWAEAGANPYSAANRYTVPAFGYQVMRAHKFYVDRDGQPELADPLLVRTFTGSTVAYNHDLSDPQIENFEIIGAGVMRWDPGFELYEEGRPPVTLSDVGRYRVGVTDPGRCQFYYGVKLFDDGSPGGPDEPLGDLPTEPAPEAEVPEPPSGGDGDPWWLSLFEFLRQLIRAVGSIPGQILDGLTGLFVPDEFPDFTSIKVDLPDGWVPDWPSVSAGSCGAINMPAVDLGMAGTVSGYKFVNTCNDPWPIVRTVIYYGLLAGVLVVVGNRVLRAVMTGLGMSVDSPSGGGDE